MSKPLVHDQFTIDRVYRAPIGKVYHALTDAEQRLKWFIAPAECITTRREYDFRVGGHEYWDGRFPNKSTAYHAQIYHIAPDQSLVYTYDMHLDGEHHSLSMVSIELTEVPDGTRLVYREVVTFFDGTESAKGREGGVGWHFSNLATLLEGSGNESDWACPHSEA